VISRCEALTLAYGTFIRRLRVEATELSGPNPALPCGVAVEAFPFKSSAKKKSEALAHITTNMFVHTTIINGNETSMGIDDRIGEMHISSVTFGAPTAHSLG
jgi:hypothetical protein